MVVIGLAAVWLLLCGSNNFKAFGATKVEVTMKKINNKKTMSVIEDMLNAALTLFLRFSAMVQILSWFVQYIHKLRSSGFHLKNHFFNICHKDIIGKISNYPYDQSGYGGNHGLINPAR